MDKRVDSDHRRYLVGLPIYSSKIRLLQERTELVKRFYSGWEYVLHSGIVKNESVIPSILRDKSEQGVSSHSEPMIHRNRETIDNGNVDALNCVTGFYRGVGVVESEPDPSPRM